MQVKTKRIYAPPDNDDGFRLLVMRRWPRGIREDAVDAWERDLGPSLPLLKDFRAEGISWEQYRTRYFGEMEAKPELIEWVRQKAKEGTVTILCGCKDENRCHRRLLKGLVLKGK